MNILEIIGQVLFLVGGTIIVFILYNLLKKVLANPSNQQVGKQFISFKKDAYCNAEVQRILIRLKLELHSSKVVLARFHNGGCFANGLDMKKFTVTHETSGGTTDNINLMDRCVGVLNSRYGIGFETLAAQYSYVVCDSEDCLDQNFKNDMGTYGFKASYLFLIKQIDGMDEGFVGVNFRNTTVLTNEQQDIIKEQIPRILDLINMKENIFNV